MPKFAVYEAKLETGRVWQQRTVRADILAAARRVAARDGIAQLTLSRVANEAGFAANTVFAYFLNKNELMVAVVADDLARLAREMRDVYPMEAEAPAAEAHQDVSHDVVERPADKQVPTETQVAPFEKHVEPEEPAASAAASSEAHAEDEKQQDDESWTIAGSTLNYVSGHSVELSDAVEYVDEFHMPPIVPVSEAPETRTEHAAAAPAEAPVEAATETPEPQNIEEPSHDTVETHVETAKPEPVIAEAVSDQPEVFPRTEEEHPETSAPALEASEQSEPNKDHAAAIAELKESVAKLEARPVDAWLERRLRELERMISSLEERHGVTERSGEAASGLFDKSVRLLQERVDTLEKDREAKSEAHDNSIHEKIEATEKRLKNMLSEVRTFAMESSGRIDMLERSARWENTLEPVEPAPVPEAQDHAEVASDVAQSEEAAPELDMEDKPAPGVGVSYLSQARRSAMAAAAQPAVPQNDSMQRFASTLSSLKTGTPGSKRFMVAGIALLVVLLGAGVILRERAASTNTQTQVMHHAPAQHVARRAKAAVMSPQIRLATLANTGNAEAQLVLGLEYLNGDGTPKNETDGAEWTARAAAKGNAFAEYTLATLYADGRGVKADPAQSLHWYEEAAMQGNRRAMHQLAVSYAEGWGTDKNFQEAARWFSRAASLGYVDSAFNLGVLYERGLGMPQSLIDAYKWYTIAASLGDKGSLERIAVLKTQMKADDITAATQAASAFTPDAMDQSANVAPTLNSLAKS